MANEVIGRTSIVTAELNIIPPDFSTEIISVTEAMIPRADMEVISLWDAQCFVSNKLQFPFHPLSNVDWDPGVGFHSDDWEDFQEMGVGQLYTKFRLSAGLSVEDVARQSKFIGDHNPNLVCCIEGGLVVPRADKLLDMIEVFGLNTGDKPARLLTLKTIQSRMSISL